MWRILDIASGYSLNSEHNRLIISKNDNRGVVPYHDIHSIVIHGDGIVISNSVFKSCIDNMIPIIYCDEKHTPAGMFLPFNQNEESARRLELQIQVSLPKKKQAWKQVVEHKLQAQAFVLGFLGYAVAEKELIGYSSSVCSGDTTNREAVGAHTYFSTIFGSRFSRRNDDAANSMLDYGYSIIRSAVARAVVGTGLYPGLSIFHSNRLNPFALVDDFMEPLRPLVDLVVIGLLEKGFTDLNPDVKKQLISLSSTPVSFNEDSYELTFAVQLMMESYLRYLKGEENQISFPSISGH